MTTKLPPAASGSALFDTNRLSSIQDQAKDGDPKALKVVAQQFEAFFLKQVLQGMRSTTFSTGLMGDEKSGALGEYTHWMDTQMADTLSQKGLGLSDALLNQWMEGFKTHAPSPKPHSDPQNKK